MVGRTFETTSFYWLLIKIFKKPTHNDYIICGVAISTCYTISNFEFYKEQNHIIGTLP